MQPQTKPEFTLAELLHCAAREVGMRESCYVKWDKKTSVAELSPSRKREINMMRAIEQLLAQQAAQPAPLADEALAELEALAEAARVAFAAWEADQGSVYFLDASDTADLELGRAVAEYLPGLLARVRQAEARLASLDEAFEVAKGYDGHIDGYPHAWAAMKYGFDNAPTVKGGQPNA